MQRELWGAFSTTAHKDAKALLVDLLLYDTLIFPQPADNRERDRWRENDWDPDLLDKRVQFLGPDLCQTHPWDEQAREEYRHFLTRVRETRFGNRNIAAAAEWQVASEATTHTIAAAAKVKLPERLKKGAGAHIPPQVVAAYQSYSEYWSSGFKLTPIDDPDPSVMNKMELTWTLVQKHVIPDFTENAEAILKDVRDAAKSDAWRKHRMAFYNWRHQVFNPDNDRKPLTPGQAAELFQHLLDERERAEEMVEGEAFLGYHCVDCRHLGRGGNNRCRFCRYDGT